MFAASLLALVFARNGVIDRIEGGFFILSLIFFTVFMVRMARTEVAGREAAELKAEVRALTTKSRRWSATVNVGLVALGSVVLVLGARFLVNGAVTLAQFFGMSDRIIGLTIVAVGTGLPELATSIVATLRKQTEIAVANVIGSNIFNILGTVGIVSLVKPTSVAPALVSFDMVWMLGFSLALLPIMRTGFRIVRAEGLLLLGGYVVYLWLII
jgi:cation:H+ antiporter